VAALRKHKESRVPVAFWWLSLGGALLELCYFLRQQDSVGIAGTASARCLHAEPDAHLRQEGARGARDCGRGGQGWLRLRLRRSGAALLGAGIAGEGHIRALPKVPGANLVAVCDVDKARAQAALDKYKSPPVPIYPT
jgi:hypothetical protein